MTNAEIRAEVFHGHKIGRKVVSDERIARQHYAWDIGTKQEISPELPSCMELPYLVEDTRVDFVESVRREVAKYQ